jgi:teichuronic acid biosynthesis glycosyltransferase TuaC
VPLIAVVTPLFPISEEFYRGKPIYKTILSLQRHADVKVFCPVTVYPPLLGPRGYRYRRVDPTYKPPGIADVEYIEYRVFPLLSRPLNGPICARRLKPRLDKLPYDLLLNYWLYPDGYASVQIAKDQRKPVVVGSRGSDLRRITDPITRWYVRKTVREADRVLTVSEELRQQAIAMGAGPAKVRTVLNGCDPTVFSYGSMKDAREQLGLPGQLRIILFVGWLAPSKGTVVLLNAFAQLAAQDPNLRLMFIGEGDVEHIKALARTADIEPQVRLLGACSGSTVAAWMRAADVLCLPSYSEGCPNVVLEATAVGCPVVASNVGGIPEVVNPKTGLLVEDHEPGTLAAALRQALAGSWNREDISRSSARSWDVVADETFEVCRDAMQPARAITGA